VPRKKKRKVFKATTAVKSLAREVVGAPPPVKRLESKKRPKKPKYRENLNKLLADSDPA